MKTVLGLSVAPHGIAWALVDGDGTPDEVTDLDDDAFEVEVAGQVAARAAAAARSARAIAAASGQDVAAIGVAGTGLDADDDQLIQLLDRLAAAGFDDVRIVPDPDPADVDERGLEAQLCDARAAAHAVATGAVAPVPAPVVLNHRPAPRKHRAVRAAAATAAAVAAGLLTVGSQFTEPVPLPDPEETEFTAAAAPQLVTVAGPHEPDRAVTTPPAEVVEEPASVEVAERAVPVAEAAPIAEAAPVSDPVPVAEPAEPAQPVRPVVPTQRAQPVTAVETAAPQAVPVTHAANPVPQHMPVGLSAPGPVPVAVAAPGIVPNAPAPGALPSAPAPVAQPAAPQPPVAADPAPFAPKPGSDLWLLNALP